MTMYNEAYGSPWPGNQPPHRWFSADYAGINMGERHQREDFCLWPPVQAGSPSADPHSPMSASVTADLFKWKASNSGSHGNPEYSHINSDAMNNSIHHAAGRHESTSSTSSFRSNGVNSPTTPHPSNGSGGPPLVIPQPVKPIQNKPGSKTYQCKMCEQMFSSKSDMLIHCQQVHKSEMKTYSPSAFRCPQCQKCFANSSYLSQHNRIHAGIKPYKCEICERKFTQLSHLQQHIRTHTGEKPYKCHHTGCGKAFSQLSNLQSHSRSHMTDRPYRCNSCYKCYPDEAGLREHIPKHSETKHIKTQICKICGKAYTQETYLARHMLKHTGEGQGRVQSHRGSVKQEPSEHSSLESAVDFTRILDRVERAQDNATPSIKSPGSSVSSAFMPLSQFGTSSSNTTAYPYGSGLNSGLSSALSNSNLSPSLPHISSMSNPRYFPYDPLGFRKSDPVDRLVNERLVNDRLVNDRLVNERLLNERLERNMNMPMTTRTDGMLSHSFLSLQDIKNYHASQQMSSSFSGCPSNARLT